MSEPDQQNVVLVTVDSLRADHCGFMGYEQDLTPTLDRMANEGVVFENAISPGPRTPESMPVIFTGEFVSESLPSDMVPQRELINRHMKARETIPEMFSKAGYNTIGFTPNPFTSQYFNFDQGFDKYQDFIGNDDDGFYQKLFQGWLGGNTISNIIRLSRNMILREEIFKPWEDFYDDIIETIQSTSEPYFLWIFLMDVHEPYIAGEGYHSISWFERWKSIWELYLGDKESKFDETTRERLITAYDDSIRYTDAFFEQLLKDLDDDTLVAMHGDHGEAFGEHGIYSHEPYLYEENVHVPLIIYGAGDRTISQATPLRSLPDILESLIRNESLEIEDELAEARTAKNDALTLRSTDLKYITSTADEELYLLPGEELKELENDDLRKLLSRLAAIRREGVLERQRVTEASTEVVKAPLDGLGGL